MAKKKELWEEPWFIVVVLIALLFFMSNNKGCQTSKETQAASQEEFTISETDVGAYDNCIELCQAKNWDTGYVARSFLDCLAAEMYITYGYAGKPPLLKCCCKNIEETPPSQPPSPPPEDEEEGILHCEASYPRPQSQADCDERTGCPTDQWCMFYPETLVNVARCECVEEEEAGAGDGGGDEVICFDSDVHITDTAERMKIKGYCIDALGTHWDYCIDNDDNVDWYCFDNMCENSTSRPCTTWIGAWSVCENGACTDLTYPNYNTGSCYTTCVVERGWTYSYSAISDAQCGDIVITSCYEWGYGTGGRTYFSSVNCCCWNCA